MGKFTDTSVLDGSLDVFATATELYVCTAQPTDRASAIAAALGAPLALVAGDFTKAAGDITGRKCTLQAKNVPLTTAGTGTHVAVCTATTLRVVDTMASTVFAAGDTAALTPIVYNNPLLA